MGTEHYSEGQILRILEEADEGASRADLCRKYGVSGATFDAWLKKYSEPSELRHALYRKNRQLDELQEVAGLGSWELDLSTKKADWSRKEYLLLGYDEAEVDAVPENFLVRIHADDKERVKKELDRPFDEDGGLYEAEFRLVMPDGTIRHVAERGQIIKDEKGKPVRYVGTTLDISKRKEAEEEREKLWAQLAQAQKMESIGRFAGGVAHDYNNMLTVILGHVELLLAQLSTDDPRRKPIEEIADAANRSADLTRQLLAISRRQVVAPRVIDLRQLVDGLHTMLQRLLGEHIVLKTVHHDGLGRVEADPGQIEQVLLNLAVNARDAMPDGGELLIETAEVTLDDAYCRNHPDATPGVYVTLSVSDTGCGMSPEIRERIFEPFFTTKPPGEGTGLGLATVFGILSQNGDRIEVHTEQGEGTSFKVYFPYVADEAEADIPAKESRPLGGHETLLVVEDEETVRRLAERVLTHYGYQVLTASSADDALVLTEQHDGPIDMLFTDVIMPGMNGCELATRLSAMRPGIKVLYASGFAEDVIARHGALDESESFISKPYLPAVLAARVRDILHRE